MKRNLTETVSKIILLLTIASISTIATLAQNDTSKTGINSNVYQVQVDTLKLQSVSINSPKNWQESAAMPWVGAVLVGVLTVVANLIISFYTRRTSIDIAQNQIESASRNAVDQFNFTLNAKNRQDWINDVRHCISEFTTHCNLINIEFQEQQQNNDPKKKLHEKITFNRSKLRLLLSPHIQEHANFLDSMKDLVTVLDKHMLNNRNNIAEYDNLSFMQKSDKVIESGRSLLYAEWQKIQKANPNN